jgi:hypothetical protein
MTVEGTPFQHSFFLTIADQSSYRPNAKETAPLRKLDLAMYLETILKINKSITRLELIRSVGELDTIGIPQSEYFGIDQNRKIPHQLVRAIKLTQMDASRKGLSSTSLLVSRVMIGSEVRHLPQLLVDKGMTNYDVFSVKEKLAQVIPEIHGILVESDADIQVWGNTPIGVERWRQMLNKAYEHGLIDDSYIRFSEINNFTSLDVALLGGSYESCHYYKF